MKKTIKVYPNKWLALDAHGHPCAVVPIDFFEHGPGRKWVGAKLKCELVKAAVTERVQKLTQVISDAEYSQEWLFAEGPVEIPLTGYYVSRIQSGELLIADEESARVAAVPYKDPIAALEASKAAAIKAYDAQHGDGAWAALHEPAETPKNSTAGKAARKSSTPQE